MTIEAIHLIVLKTFDIEKAKIFYELLGCSFQKEQHGNGPKHYSCEIGNCIFEIYPLKNSQAKVDTSLRLGFCVSDMEKVVEKLEKLNYPVISKPKKTSWGICAVIKDIDGRSIELKQAE